jgi:hypothetical protein
MPKYDVIAFVRELNRLGLRLSTLRHMDGTVRLYRWRLMNYGQNESAIRQMWDQHVGNDDKSVNQLAEAIENLGSRAFEAPSASPSAA